MLLNAKRDHRQVAFLRAERTESRGWNRPSAGITLGVKTHVLMFTILDFFGPTCYPCIAPTLSCFH